MKRMKSATAMFSEAFGNRKESIMDYSNGRGLCEEIWAESDGTFVMRKDVREAVMEIANWAISKYSLKDPIVRVIGSICSNAYDEESDIDIHLTDITLSKEDRERINASLSEEFKKEFEPGDRDLVNKHPFEVYVQENRFRDLLSVGCYNVMTDRWEAGPTMYADDYDPFEEYFEKIYTTNDELITKIHNFTLSVLEFSYTVKVSQRSSESFKTMLQSLVGAIVENAASLLEESRGMRGALTEPRSEEEAKEIRENEQWKISDATFKLLGKYGYMPLLKKISKLDPNTGIEEASDMVARLCMEKLFQLKNIASNATNDENEVEGNEKTAI